MTLAHYWSIVQKQWKFILACFLITGLMTLLLVSKFMTPIYQSTVLIQVVVPSTGNQSDYTSLLASDQLVQTEAQLALSNPVLQEVAKQSKGLTSDQLKKQATAVVRTNTQLLEIDVQDSNPTQAASLANGIAATFIQQQVDSLQQDNSKSQQHIQQRLNTTQQQIDNLTSQIVTQQQQTGKQVQVAIQQTQLTELQQSFTASETTLAQLELTQAQNSGFLRVVQPAQPATSPIRPLILINTTAGFVAGLLLGVLLALLFEQLDTRIRTPETLLQLIDWPLLATLRLVKLKTGESVVNPQSPSANVESYRILRTNIGFASIDKPVRSVLVTSATPSEGKSTIAANLAIFMAKAGKRTLLVDADLRRPTQHNIFGISAGQMGLSNAIMTLSQFQAASQASQPSGNNLANLSVLLEPFICPVNIPNLFVMPSGPLPPNPPELLDSKAMERFFATVTNCEMEFVIFDAPPLLGLSDSNILASKVDGVLCVIDLASANKGKLQQLKANLAQSAAKVLGCVANKDYKKHEDNSYSYYNSSDQNGPNIPNVRGSQVPSVPATPTMTSTLRQ